MGERIGVLHVVDCLNVGGTERQLFELLRRIDRTRYRPLARLLQGAAASCLGVAARARHRARSSSRCAARWRRPNTAFQVARMALLIRSETCASSTRTTSTPTSSASPPPRSPARARSPRAAIWRTGSAARSASALRLACRMADAVIANAGAVAEQTARELGVDADDKMHVVPNGIDVAHVRLHAFRTPDPLLPAGSVAAAARLHGRLDAPARQGPRRSAGGGRPPARRAAYARSTCSSPTARCASRSRSRRARSASPTTSSSSAAATTSPACSCAATWSCIRRGPKASPTRCSKAMCAARPVVATRVGGIPEVMQHGVHGLLVEPQRPTELADAARAASSPIRSPAHVMGLRGRRHVEREFSLDKMRRTVESLYENLLAPASPTQRHAASLHAANG